MINYKRRILVFSLMLLLIATTLKAGTSIEIKDKLSDKAMRGVTVHLKALGGKYKDSTIVVVTNSSGLAVNPFQSRTFVALSFTGYHTRIDTLNPKESKCFYMVQSSLVTDEIVVTGQFKPVSAQKSVFDIKVIDRAKISAQGANNLRDLLITEANMQVSQDNILGSSININGISGENIKIMMDGIPVIGRLNGNIDLSQINLNNIKKVEIIEGPMSSIYGSDALGGVINLISKEPDCNRMEVEMASYYESSGVYNFDAALRYSIDDLSFFFNGGRNLFQGYDPDNDSRDLQWNPKEQYFTDFQAAWSLENHKLKLSAKYFDEYILNRGALRAPYYETAFDDKYYTKRFTGSLFYNGKLSDNHYLGITAAYSNYNRKKNSYFKDMTTLEEQLTESGSDHDTSNFYTYMFRAVFSDDNVTDYLKYQAGIDINIDEAKGKKIEDGQKDMSDYAAFVSAQVIPVATVLFQPSLRFIENSNYDAPLVPALNLKYDILDNLAFRASYAKGFRSPSIKELYYKFVDINHNIYGNRDLKAERSDSYNAGFALNFQGNNSYLSFEPKFFYNNITDMITLANVDGDIYKNINIGNYETIGSNLTVKYFLKTFSVKSTFSYTGRLNSYFEETDTRKYNYSPEFMINADYLIGPINTKVNLYFKYTGEKPAFSLVDNEAVEYIINDYKMFDISLSRNFFEYFDLVAGVKNLFNVVDIQSTAAVSQGAHSSGSSYPIGWGRTFFVNLKIKVN